MHEGEGNIFYDYSRYGHNATFYGSSTDWLDSPFGKVIFFPGTDDHYAKVGGVYEIMEKIENSNAITITAWINTGEDGQVLYDCQCWPDPLCEEIILEYKDGGKIYFEVDASASCETSESFADGQWHFIVAQADEGITRIVVDGEVKAECDGGTFSSFLASCSDQILYIGTKYPEPSNLFEGFICDLRIYDRLLTLDEIKALELYYRNFEVRPSILCPRPTL